MSDETQPHHPQQSAPAVFNGTLGSRNAEAYGGASEETCREGADVVDQAVQPATDSEGNMPADSELSAILSRRCAINDGLEEGRDLRVKNRVFNVYTEFSEYSVKQVKAFLQAFKTWDANSDGFLDLHDLKRMMESLGAPQTHLGLKQMIKEGGNQEKEGAISFKEFMFVLRRAKAGELDCEGLNDMAKLTEINVDEVGVGGAKNFFEAKIKEQSQASKFEAEIRAEKEEKQRQAEEAKQRRIAFRDKANLFEKGASTAS